LCVAGSDTWYDGEGRISPKEEAPGTTSYLASHLWDDLRRLENPGGLASEVQLVGIHLPPFTTLSVHTADARKRGDHGSPDEAGEHKEVPLPIEVRDSVD
jgi:hypothetical protein